MLLDQAGEKTGFSGVSVWNREAFQGKYLQRCSCRQETQPELSGAAAPACIPACIPACPRAQGGCKTCVKKPSRRWEERGGKRQGLPPAAHNGSRRCHVNQMSKSSPVPRLIDFPASNYYNFFKELQFNSILRTLQRHSWGV